MSRLNNDLLELAKHVSDKLDNPSDIESIRDIDLQSDGKSERQLPTSTSPVDNFIKPKLPPPKSKKTIVCTNHKMSSGEKQSSDESDQDERIPEDENKVDEVEKIPKATSTNYYIVGAGMEEVIIIENSRILPVDDLSDEDELWLIIAPQEYNVKKQHVDMTCRQQLKGGQYEILFWSQTGNDNKMMTLLSDKNQFINGPSFKGCCQISERLQTFSAVYHDSVAKENPIPEGLKKRHIPLGANGFEKDKKGGSLSQRSSKRKHETENKVGEKNLAKKQDSELISTSPIKKKKKKRAHVDS